MFELLTLQVILAIFQFDTGMLNISQIKLTNGYKNTID